jgi:hypothetical protein
MARGTSRVAAVWVLAASSLAAAPRDPAAAEQLFREARKALAGGRTEEACEKFAESQRLDPGVGTLINLAACEEKLGKLASAWEKWQRALEGLRADDKRRPGVEKRAAALEARVPRLEIRLSAGAPPGTAVMRDAVELGPASLGLALPVDPGPHRVSVSAPGREPKSYELSLEEAEMKTLEVEPGPAPAVRQPSAPLVPAEPEPAPGPDQDTGRRTAGFVTLGVGAAGLLVGSIAGLLALQKKGEMDDDCSRRGDRLECGDAGIDAAAAGNTFAAVSTVAFAVGVAGIGVGGYLVLTSDGARSVTARGACARPCAAFLGVRGEF